VPGYVPAKGDLVAVSMDPQAGHEQRGRRPALVVSNDLFNIHTGMAVVCPLTRTHRGVPFHVAVAEGSSLTGFVMVEQMKSIDYAARRATFIEKASPVLLDEVLAILDACLY